MPPPITAETAVQRYVRETLAAICVSQTSGKSQPAPLQTVILEWFSSQPVVSRHRRYSMHEVAMAVEARTGHRYQTQVISAQLETLGWVSGRDWTRAGRNRRYWLPQQQSIYKE